MKFNNSDAYFLPLGGGQQVGASCYFLRLGNKNILLDCGIGFYNGMIFEPNFRFLQQLPYIESLAQINQIYISHAHMDHIGCLPYIMKTCPQTPVFMTPVTKELSSYQLYTKVFYDNYLKKGKEDERLAVKYLFEKIVTVPYYKTLFFPDLTVSFYPAGHIPGAMMILFEYNGRSILYTGDYSVSSTPLTAGCSIPDKKIDTLITCAIHAKNSSYKKQNGSLYKTIFYIQKLLRNGKSVYCQIKQLSKGLEFLEFINMQISEGIFYPVKIYIDDSIFGIIESVEKSLKPLIKKYIHSARSFYHSGEPCLYLSSRSESRYGFEYVSVDFSLHDDFLETVDFIKRINPKEAVIVHTAKETDFDDGNTVETKLMFEPDCDINFIFAENEEVYKLS